MMRVNLMHAHGTPGGHLYDRHCCRCASCCAAKAERDRRYRDANPEKVAARDRRRGPRNASHKSPASREQQRRTWMIRTYGISPEERESMFAAQGNVCAICGTTEPGSKRGWATDHDHKTGVVRGILCQKHNTGLGNFDDDPEHLMAAIEYLAAATL